MPVVLLIELPMNRSNFEHAGYALLMQVGLWMVVMKLVALKADPMVPWFDSLSLFQEIGIFNTGEDGVFVIAEYNG